MKLLREREGAVERWVMNNPAQRNALDDEVVEALHAACAEASRDASLRFIVLTGSGGSFCAGGNLGGFGSLIGQPLAAGETDPLIAMNMRFGDLLQALCALPQVLVATVDGPAMAGGFGLVCCADFVIASRGASFATPEVTLGIAPAQIAPVVWKRLGDRAARQLLLRAQRFDAVQAQAMGLVDEVADDLAAVTQSFIQSLSVAAPQAVAVTKRLLRELDQHATKDLRLDAAQAFAASLRGSEAPEGLAAFARKRAASWAR
ncbi:enoyl-CoA hydratase/isomerase family protein [Piscinibacter terrae]|uniref:Enoyl-CoA hydratase/isomerase family protein n=1 Tax=Piscinibacter terrae TaxID=2496871 RepID=A0A3N7JY95_9BURK|nr:enoyl-CoA hydratase-related protein [Albitalea terrae]RQP25789.1 enoyl-CoA hydratase/isomerase family protein [Albitalea terrae]